MSTWRKTAASARSRTSFQLHPLPRLPAHQLTITTRLLQNVGWLYSFNEWLSRCGLSWTGHPGTDNEVKGAAVDNKRALSLHGRLSHIPATDVTLRVDTAGKIHLRGPYAPRFLPCVLYGDSHNSNEHARVARVRGERREALVT